MTQQAKMFAAKPDILSLILGTPMVEGESWLTSSPLTPHIHTMYIVRARI